MIKVFIYITIIDPTSSKFMNAYKYVVDCVDINSDHLKRTGLIVKLHELVCNNLFVRLTSPAASGKTTLLKLYWNSLKNTQVIWISCLENKSGAQLLNEVGIDLFKKNTNIKKDTVVFLDDAQAKFGDIEFWNLLIKVTPTWISSNIRFIISSTHLISFGESSPVVFEALAKLERSDFLLSSAESNELLDSSIIGLPQK